MPAFTLGNLMALSVQAAGVVIVAAAAMRLLRVAAADVRYACWRATLALCLVLPLLQPAVPPPPASAAATESAPIADAAPPVWFAPAHEIDWTAVALAVIVGGACARLLWMAIGFWRLRRWRRAGEPLPAAEYADLQQRLGTRAEVLALAGLDQPMTFGWRRPVVVIPAALGAAPPSMRDAVLAHELLHVARRDWVWLLCEEVVRAALWFHPAIWWLISQVQRAREEAVDAAAVRVTGRRREYLEALTSFADATPLAPAPAFARRRHLFHRIVLLSTEETMSTRRVVASVCAITAMVAAGSWYAVHAFPVQIGARATLLAAPGPLEQASQPISADNPMPRRLHAPSPAHPEANAPDLSAAVTLRTVVDAAGTVAELRLVGFSFDYGGVSIVFKGGHDTLDQLTGFFDRGEVGVRRDGISVSSRELQPLLEPLIDAAAAAVQQWRYDPPRHAPIAFDTIVQFMPARVRASEVPSPALERDGAIRVGGGVKVPTKVRDVKPVYPAEALQAGVQGVVILDIRIEGDGTVSAARVLRSIPLLDQAAIEAVSQWQFTPTLLNGAPTPVALTVTVQFSLSRGGGGR